MHATEIRKTEGAIWDRMLEPKRPTLTPAVARAILALEFPESDKARMRELAAKARAGKLSAAEEGEVDIYGRVGSVLSIWKSKARRSLKRPSNGKS